MGRASHWIGVVIIGLASWASAAQGEIYRWVDERGQVHFTEDLRQVPPSQRGSAEAPAAQGPSPIQVYSAPAARAPVRRTTRPSAADSGLGPVHRVRVQRAGSSMRVSVRINGRLDVPFLIDTGATDVVLPKWAADQLGLDLSNARTGRYATANGVVEQKLVRLGSVSLQGAEVENVPATVSPSMREGLLGLSFFNHFKYDVDPGSGVVTLQRNALAKSGLLRGGKSESQWRRHFAVAEARISEAERRLDEVAFGRARRRGALEDEVERLERELQLLHQEADEAQVPFPWRH